MAGIAPVVAAVGTYSAAYATGRIIGAGVVAAIAVLAALSIRRRDRTPVRPRSVLLTLGGILLSLTVVGELMLAVGLTK
jgi:hypothetical protein